LQELHGVFPGNREEAKVIEVSGGHISN
jgi:hypothetical protein